MRSILGLLWALVGSVVGCVLGVLASVVLAKVSNTSDREGAQGYVMIAMGLAGALIGLITGLVLYARSAPSGQSAAFLGSGTTGVVGLVAALALALWAFMNFRETPLKYGGSMATLELEFRVLTTALPADFDGYLFNVEVQTTKTSPAASVSWSSRRVEAPYMIIPAFQGPLYRAGTRFIVVRMKGLHDEMFRPPMKRTPDPKAGWSPWYTPDSVDPPYGVVPSTPLSAMLEMRYRVRPYGSTD
jgi:hypothetical protein